MADQTSTYLELSSTLYSTMVDAYAAANQRMLAYGKSVYEIVSRPYTSTAVESALRENFDRANQIVETTVSELQQNGKHATDLSQNLVAQNAQFQELLVETGRTIARMGASNMAFAKESADAQFQTITKSVNDMQQHAKTVSAN
jgi:lysophospholipase L1-like esterase